MAGELDSIDIGIMRVLQEDGRATNTKIAKELGVGEETVRRRKARLLENMQMRIEGIPNPTKLGFESQGLVGLQVDPDKVDEVSDALAALNEVTKVVITTGSFDVFAWTTLRSTEALSDFLRTRIGQISGVQRTVTFVELVNKKRTHSVRI